jgi:hypothetical protein
LALRGHPQSVRHGSSRESTEEGAESSARIARLGKRSTRRQLDGPPRALGVLQKHAIVRVLGSLLALTSNRVNLDVEAEPTHKKTHPRSTRNRSLARGLGCESLRPCFGSS